MKNSIILLSLLLAVQFSYAQEKQKFGDISLDILKMKTYDKDTTASAVVLYEYCDTY